MKRRMRTEVYRMKRRIQDWSLLDENITSFDENILRNDFFTEILKDDIL